jgi:hypothetical protein
MLLYSICYYYGKNKQSNIINHLNAFLKIDCHEKKEFVLVNMVDSHDSQYINQAEHELSEFIIKFNPNISFKIISEFNWGGTIVALWLTYNYGKKYDNSCYIAQFEEDFGPYNNEWLKDSIQLLNEGIIYVGENTNGVLKSGDDDGRLSGYIYRDSVRFGNPEVWTDGGFYFSNMSRLKSIDDKIGIFHKGNQQTKYINKIDGIDYGEVGFPTMLYHNGFRFTTLHRAKYFINEW